MPIRRALPDDAAAIAAISVRGWQAAYRGLFPDAYLDGLSVAERRSAWHHYLVTELEGYRMWVLEADDGLAGFTRTGPGADADSGPHTGQVFGLYVDPDRFGCGHGRELFRHALDDLRARGFREAIVWLFEGNERAARFYAAAGAVPDGARRLHVSEGHEAPELRYRLALNGT